MQRLEIVNHKNIRLITILLLSFFVYVMGTIYIANPETRTEALGSTPVALLLTTGVLLFFAATVYTSRMVWTFLVIALAGFFAEWVGVRTGWIFGAYTYTHRFGILLGDTPLLIGVNWLFLTYACAAVARNTAFSPLSSIFLAALLMVAYDILLERAAPLMDLWHWKEDRVPLKNYVSWFLLGLCFQWFLHRNRIITRNPMALPLLLLQAGMFLCLILLLK